MGEQKYHIEHDYLGSIRGFTLIELLIGIVLSGIVAFVLYEMLSTQNRVYVLQDDVSEMQQNLRVASEKISRDLTMAGLGKPLWSTINQQDASAWYNAANSWRAYNITGSGDNCAIEIVGCVDATVGHLSSSAASGSTTITLNTGEGSRFNTSTKQDINIGSIENAKVTAVNGDALTIDTDPVTSGNQGLQFNQGVNTFVCGAKWVTYSRGASDNMVYMNGHQNEGNRPVAKYITGLTVQVASNVLTLTLKGRSRNPDRTTGQYLTSQVTSKVLLRN